MTISSHSVQFKKALTFSNSFNVMRMLCLPSHTFHTSTVGAKNKELEPGARQSVNAASTLWSLHQQRWVRQQQHLAKQIKHMVVLINNHIFISSHYVQFKNALAFSNSFNVMHMLCLPSHTFHTSFVAHAWLTSSKAHATPTNPHVLVQRSWRCLQGIHWEYVHLVQY